MLNLNNAGIGSAGVKLVASALERNTTLVVLFLDNNGIGSSGCQALAGSVARHPSLEFLFLSYNAVGNTGAKALAKALKENKKLQVIKLMSCEISTQGAVALGEALRYNSTLKTLNLEGNRVGDQGALALASDLKDNASLLHLDLRYAGIRNVDHVIVAFCAALSSRNKTLQTLLLAEETPQDAATANTEAAEELQFYLDLNRIGRHSFGSCTFPPTVWTRVLATASRHPRLLHAILLSRPDLLQRDCRPPKKRLLQL